MTRLLVIALVTLASCVSIHNKKDFTYYKNTNAASLNLLSIDGYYYHLDSLYFRFNYKSTNPSVFSSDQSIHGKYQDSIKAYIISTIVLYKNGRVLVYDNEYIFHGLKVTADQNYMGENTYKAAKLYFQTFMANIDKKNYRTDKVYKTGIWCWGVYKFEGETLRIQYFSRNGLGSYDLIELECPILNKTTFKIVTRKNISESNSKKEVDRLYSFEKYANKPDSTNNYLDHLIEKQSRN